MGGNRSILYETFPALGLHSDDSFYNQPTFLLLRPTQANWVEVYGKFVKNYS